MQIAPKLNHINILTHDMDRLSQFYSDVLGIERGYRPPFQNKGAWLYVGETALIHLVETAELFQNKGGAVSHFALDGSGLGDFLAHLRSLRVSYRISVSPEINLHQVFAHDPDGNMFEVLFDGSEAAGVDLEPYDSEANNGD